MEKMIILSVLAIYAVSYFIYYMYGKKERSGRDYDRYRL